MNKLIKLFLFFTICNSSNAYALDIRKCLKQTDASNELALLMSTTSFVSSIKDCAIWSQADKADLYIALNYDHIKNDVARGQGEYLVALANIYNCDVHSNHKFSNMMQSNYSEVFQSQIADESIRKNINSQMQIHQLDKSCEILN